MATDEQWARRLRTAKRAAEERTDTKLTYKAMGERLGAALGREPFKHTTVRSWFEEGQEPESFALIRALAQLLGTTVGALLDQPVGETSHIVVRTSEPERVTEPAAGKGRKRAGR